METDQLLAVAFIALIAAASVYFKLLKTSGAFAAFVTGLLVWIGFGINGLLLMGIFFLTSSLLSRYKRKKKEELGEIHEKGSARDWVQVAANGGTGAIAGLANFIEPNFIWLIMFAIALASANADTWASELGVLSKKQPMSVKAFKRVPRGTSGAVSGFGTLASVAASLLIATSAYSLFEIEPAWVFGIFFGGMAGTALDTLMGAYFQAGFKCAECGLHTEKTVHCAKITEKVSGYAVINNDAVNFLSCFTAAILGMIVYMVL
ncbi:DUF92 domain-containing protein [Mesobacillus subterraneus]|uniref:DUF92 domain-containing protein n=1 Tax=Mesobacillus subterraneus TaxID=285983 RepID=UPI0014764F7E|nr:DUF92 domain-containing protein [Mesobacillus subterraneus]